jgi:hypothetical protein
MVSAKSESMLKIVCSAQNDAPPKLVVVLPGVIADFRYDDWAARDVRSVCGLTSQVATHRILK